MVLAFELGLGLHALLFRRPDDARPSIRQFPVEFRLPCRRLGIVFDVLRRRGILSGLVKARHAALALQATHAVDDDERHQCQSQYDQPLSKFHGSSCLFAKAPCLMVSVNSIARLPKKGPTILIVKPAFLWPDLHRSCAIALQESLRHHAVLSRFCSLLTRLPMAFKSVMPRPGPLPHRPRPPPGVTLRVPAWSPP